MKTISLPLDFNAWRDAARDALRAGYKPEELNLQDASSELVSDLFLSPDEPPTGTPILKPHTNELFLSAALDVAVHRSAERWNLLYRVLYRLQEDRNLLKLETDPDVSEMLRLRAQIRRDLHKMHAFVRFRKVLETDAQADATQDAGAIEHYIAWYQPDHRILTLAAPFFAERFAAMHWTILTPDASVSWSPVRKEFTYGDGVPLSAAPSEDEVEGLWRKYYSSIFNPARLNVRAMRSEMPTRFWKNLPEVATLPALIAQSENRVTTMINVQQEKTSAASFVPQEHTLQSIEQALPSCKGCELYSHATQVVPGAGSGVARLLLIGEQPGDQEDLQGRPFVGPAGALLDSILNELKIDRSTIYVTNAVKHFKFIQRGKFRLHQNPRMSEITACKPWLLAELDALKPRVVVCLGASAAKSIFGGTFQLMKNRGQVLSSPFAERVVATFHPSAVLRAQDEPQRTDMRRALREDLEMAARLAE